MKKPILVRLALSLLAALVTILMASVLTPAMRVLSADAALRQMSNADSAYIQAMVGMDLAALLNGVPGLVLLLLLVVIWGSLWLRPKNKDGQ